MPTLSILGHVIFWEHCNPQLGDGLVLHFFVTFASFSNSSIDAAWNHTRDVMKMDMDMCTNGTQRPHLVVVLALALALLNAPHSNRAALMDIRCQAERKT